MIIAGFSSRMEEDRRRAYKRMAEHWHEQRGIPVRVVERYCWLDFLYEVTLHYDRPEDELRHAGDFRHFWWHQPWPPDWAETLNA